jgi:hypothetical protein
MTNALRRFNLELLVWIVGLSVLAISSPESTHFTICPLKIAGFDFCPGCGLGHSISYLFRGNLAASFNEHWFGVPALAIMLHRIYYLTAQVIKHTKPKTI